MADGNAVTPAAMDEPGRTAPGGWRIDPASKSAELAIDELREITGVEVNEAEKIILAARAHWFSEEN